MQIRFTLAQRRDDSTDVGLKLGRPAFLPGLLYNNTFVQRGCRISKVPVAVLGVYSIYMYWGSDYTYVIWY